MVDKEPESFWWTMFLIGLQVDSDNLMTIAMQKMAKQGQTNA